MLGLLLWSGSRMAEQERPKDLDVHADNASAAIGVELHNAACENARYAKVLEGRIAEAIAEFRQAAAAPMAEKNLLFDIAMDTLLGRTDD